MAPLAETKRSSCFFFFFFKVICWDYSIRIPYLCLSVSDDGVYVACFVAFETDFIDKFLVVSPFWISVISSTEKHDGKYRHWWGRSECKNGFSHPSFESASSLHFRSIFLYLGSFLWRMMILAPFLMNSNFGKLWVTVSGNYEWIPWRIEWRRGGMIDYEAASSLYYSPSSDETFEWRAISGNYQWISWRIEWWRWGKITKLLLVCIFSPCSDEFGETFDWQYQEIMIGFLEEFEVWMWRNSSL